MATRKATQIEDAAGNLYDVKDAAAQADITELKSALETKTDEYDFQQMLENGDITVAANNNLFNKDTALTNTALRMNYGDTTSETGKYTSDFIPVELGKTYKMGKNGNAMGAGQYCLYDANKDYIVGYQYFGTKTIEVVNEKTPAFLRFTANASSIPLEQAQVNEGTEIKAYDSYGNTYIFPYEKISEVEKILSDVGVVLVQNNNLFNKDTALENTALRQNYGDTTSETGKYTSDFIPVELGKTYIMGKNGVAQGVNQYCLYDSNKGFIKGYQYFNSKTIEVTEGKTPAYLRFTAAVSQVPLDKAQVNKGAVKPYDNYGTHYVANGENKKVITIGASGKDYTSIRTAFETEGDNCHYIIYEGTYDVAQDFTAEEINNASYDSSHSGWCGIDIPDNSIVEGIGKVVIDCQLSSDYNYNKRMQIATLNATGTFELRNLIIKASGNRVPLHDDFVSSAGKTHKCVDCTFIQTVIDSGTSFAYAIGIRNGQIIEIDGCTFVPAFGAHDSNGLSIPAKITIRNSNCQTWLSFSGNENGMAHTIIVENCDYQWFSCVQRNMIVKNFSDCDGRQRILNANYETFDSFIIKKIKVESGVVANDIVTEYGQKITEWNGLAYGVALENRDANGYARVMKLGKSIYASFVGISSYSDGDNIGLQNGRLIVDQNGTVGIIKNDADNIGYILFK